LYSHNRHNEFNLNLAYLKAAYSSERVRGNIALMAGTYVQDNLSGEEAQLRPLYEANIGFRLAPKWWIDAGVLPSHIGFESAKSSDCATLTRSLIAENSPYYETGTKLSYAPDQKLSIAFLALNGWQRIGRLPGSKGPNFGTQVYWKPIRIITLNHSSFVGYDKTAETLRVFNNFYGIIDFHSKWQLTVGLDYGWERRKSVPIHHGEWIGTATILRWQCSDKNAIAFRSEFYSDDQGIILGKSLSVAGFSLNFDRKIAENALWRVEGRFFQANKSTFWDEDGVRRTSPWLSTSFSIGF
jgi:Putative beta-barrel porin-2, OmpL-like. bbp2